jgi:hypothetical protein
MRFIIDVFKFLYTIEVFIQLNWYVHMDHIVEIFYNSHD